MTTFAMIHGAGDVGWYWHLVEQELRRRGHDTVAPDLPCQDDSAGLAEYAGTVIEAIGGRDEVILVAQSFGGFTAPLVADRVPVPSIVQVHPLIPVPRERPPDRPAHTGFDQIVRDPGQEDVFYHDVPPDLADQARSRSRGQSDTPGQCPWPLPAWPDVPTRFILCTEDRFFPPAFMRRVVADRLGVIPDEIAAGHCVALSRPKELADLLAGSAAGRGGLRRPGWSRRRS